MKKVRCSLAMSLDGFIAGPNGEVDWIEIDPSLEFESFFKEFDTVIMGRRTFEVAQKGPGGGAMPGMRTIICSKTLQPRDDSTVSIVPDAVTTVAALKAKTGKDIWLFGGGALFRSLLDAKLVDVIEVNVMPILLSQGIPLLPAGGRSPRMRLVESKALPGGTVALTYALSYPAHRKKKP